MAKKRPTKKQAKPQQRPKRAQQRKPPEPLSGLDAAAEVLKTTGPSHVSAIAQEAISRGLWAPQGQTPAATIGSALLRDIAKHGSASRFVRTGPNTYGLRK